MADEKEPQGPPPRIQLLPNKLYDYLKWACLVLLPSIGAFYYAGAELFDWPNSRGFNGMINLIIVFLGSVLGISSRSYNTSDTKYDGQIVVVPVSKDESTLNVTFDQEALVKGDKKEIVLKILR
jgi:hypothetical protein